MCFQVYIQRFSLFTAVNFSLISKSTNPEDDKSDIKKSIVTYTRTQSSRRVRLSLQPLSHNRKLQSNDGTGLNGKKRDICYFRTGHILTPSAIAGQLFLSNATHINVYTASSLQPIYIYIYTSSIQLGAHVQMTALTGPCFQRGPPRLYLSAITVAPIQLGHSVLASCN